MNKSFFYSTIVAIALGTAVLPSIASAQDFVSAEQTAVTIADLEAALEAENPDVDFIQRIVTDLISQDSSNVSKIAAAIQDAPLSIQNAVNATIAQISVSADNSQPIINADADSEGDVEQGSTEANDSKQTGDVQQQQASNEVTQAVQATANQQATAVSPAGDNSALIGALEEVTQEVASPN
ncbi:MAG: hypothetical protein ACJARD_001432 [Alphaproteobacteria bacterium]|jgi:hypothetical protein